MYGGTKKSGCCKELTIVEREVAISAGSSACIFLSCCLKTWIGFHNNLSFWLFCHRMLDTRDNHNTAWTWRDKKMGNRPDTKEDA